MTPEKLTLVQHLRELKRRLAWALLALLVAFIVAYLLADHVFAWLTAPLQAAYDDASGRRLIFTGLPEAFLVKISLSLFAAFLMSFPVIAAQLYYFLAPGLHRHEKKVILPFLVAAPILFYAGAALAYGYVFPVAWKFFLGFEHLGAEGLPVMLEARISEYLSLAIHVIIAFGLAFQLPVVLTLLARAGLIAPETLAARRKYAVVILLIVAGVVTPPDVISQIALFMPLYLLYEVAIVTSRWAGDTRAS